MNIEFPHRLLISVTSLGQIFEFSGFPGKLDGNEMDRHHGLMTVREAVQICEKDHECAGFSFKGPMSLLNIPFETIFKRFLVNTRVV